MDVIVSYAKASKADKLSKSVQEQLNQAVQDGDQLAETQQARVDANGNPHDTLKTRIDSEVQGLRSSVSNVNTQVNSLAQDVTQQATQIEGVEQQVQAIEGDMQGVSQQVQSVEDDLAVTNVTVLGISQELNNTVRSVNGRPPDASGNVVIQESGGGGVAFRDVLDGEKFTLSDSSPDPDPDPIAVTGVNIDKSSYTLELGQTVKLNATVIPSNASNKNVTWHSSNTSVATVNSQGVVTSVAEGNTVITVTTVDGNYTATCNLTVELAETEPVAVTGVTIDRTSHTLRLGQTVKLNATVLPSNATNKLVTWSSSDTDVAIVDSNGLVTSVSEGDTIITVTTVEGSFTATCDIIVEVIEVDTTVNAYRDGDYLYLNPKTLAGSNVVERSGEPTHVYFTFSGVFNFVNPSLSSIGDVSEVQNVFNDVIPFGGSGLHADFTEGNMSVPSICYIYENSLNTLYFRIPRTLYESSGEDIRNALYSVSERLPILYGATEEIFITENIIDNFTAISSYTLEDGFHKGFLNMAAGFGSHASIVNGISSLSGRFTNTTTGREHWYVNATTRLNFRIPVEKLEECTIETIKQYLRDNTLIFWLT